MPTVTVYCLVLSSYNARLQATNYSLPVIFPLKIHSKSPFQCYSIRLWQAMGQICWQNFDIHGRRYHSWHIDIHSGANLLASTRADEERF